MLGPYAVQQQWQMWNQLSQPEQDAMISGDMWALSIEDLAAPLEAMRNMTLNPLRSSQHPSASGVHVSGSDPGFSLSPAAKYVHEALAKEAHAKLQQQSRAQPQRPQGACASAEVPGVGWDRACED